MTWQPTVYRSMPSVTRQLDGRRFLLTGQPPIFGGVVRQVSVTRWRAGIHGPVLQSPQDFGQADDALRWASGIIGHLTGHVWRSTFTGAQRIMIGRDRRCPMAQGPDVLCGQAPDVGSVWCEAHPWGQA